MDCKRVDEDLVGFALAAIDGATRAAVETHLVGCRRCVGAFLALKRAIDAGEEASAPSEMVRARIRQAAAAATTAKPQRRRVWIVAATATVAAAAAIVGLLVTRPSPEAASVPLPIMDRTVDTARAVPVNLSYL